MVFKRSNEQSMREAIEALLRVYRLETGIDKVRLSTTWERIMGVAMVKRARILSLQNGVLMIKVSSPSLRQELSMSKTRIAALLNKELGKEAVKEVVII